MEGTNSARFRRRLLGRLDLRMNGCKSHENPKIHDCPKREWQQKTLESPTISQRSFAAADARGEPESHAPRAPTISCSEK